MAHTQYNSPSIHGKQCPVLLSQDIKKHVFSETTAASLSGYVSTSFPHVETQNCTIFLHAKQLNHSHWMDTIEQLLLYFPNNQLNVSLDFDWAILTHGQR
ncbi:hypothetical protein ILYODFUR_018418 [Ilyodon furcidens]|uniref:Uncharacterized protein n=1 Tax=Ilyodon furcidens TaxID=33524 RepID=A0ABV0SMA3_9TELE